MPSIRTIAYGLAVALIPTMSFGEGTSADLPDSLLQSRTVEFTYSVNVSRISNNAKNAFAWVPVPQSTADQVIQDIIVESAWPHEMLSEKEFGNRFVWLNFSDRTMSSAPGAAEATIALRVKRQARVNLTQEIEPNRLAKKEVDRFLLPSRFVSIEGAVAREAERIVGDETNPLHQARLLYNHIVDTVVYDKSGEGWGRGDSQFACDVRTGNCTDFHSLFMGEARHLGIPARFIMGFGLPDERGEGIIGGYHCWAEFYVDDYGWIPIDASEAHKNPLKRDLLFGGLDTSRIQFTKGRDIRLPEAQGDPVNFSIYPYIEVDGRPHSSVAFAFAFKDIE